MLRILFLGDIIGKIARKALIVSLQDLRDVYRPDIVLANAENLAHGTGITKKTIQEMMDIGIDCFTSGNHIWKKGEAREMFKSGEYPVLRPANYPPGVEGIGEKVMSISLPLNSKQEKKEIKLLVVNLLGRVFFKEDPDCPFRKMDEILEKHQGEDLGGIIVDFHAEATSEKVALGRYLEGKVSAVLGTHTHVPTADERILSGGTAYITDIGMVGAKDSVIGVDKKNILGKFLTQTSGSHEMPEKGAVEINAVLVEIDETTRQAINICRVYQEVVV